MSVCFQSIYSLCPTTCCCPSCVTLARGSPESQLSRRERWLSSAVLALTASSLLVWNLLPHLLNQMMSGDPELTKVWVPIPSPVFCISKGILKIRTQVSRRQMAAGILSYSDGWFLSPEQPQPLLWVKHGEEACGCNISMQQRELSASALQKHRGKRAEWLLCSTVPQGGKFFFLPAGDIHPSQQTQGKAWDEVSQLVRGGASEQPQQSRPVSQQSSCIQAAAYVKLSGSYLGYCFIVPHGSHPSSKHSFYNY